MTARRIASIWFPKLAIERWAKLCPERADEPLALVTEGPRGVVIDALTEAGLAGGARIGMKLTDARAAFPALAVIPSDKAGDAALLARLARWCERWTPLAQIDGDDGLLLDMTGGTHLFGGEAECLADLSATLCDLSLTPRVALAPTIGAAWALARFGPDRAILPATGRGPMRSMREGHEAIAAPATCPSPTFGGSPPPAGEDVHAMLAPLPVQALRLDDETCLLLHRLGLKRIGDLAAIPSRALTRRFSRRDGDAADPWLRLAQASGRIAEPLDPFVHDAPPAARLRLAEPILELAQLAPLLADLAEQLARRLDERRAGVRRLRFDAFRVDGDVQSLEARTSTPSRDPAHLVRLFVEKLGDLDAGFGFDAFALTALWHEPLAPAQDGLIEQAVDPASLSRLIDRLSARLGTAKVHVPAPIESNKPERRLAWRPALGGMTPPAAFGGVDRPIRLFDRPEPIAVTYATPEGAPRQFNWRRRHHRIVRHQGPERIAPEWWRERSNARLRDYYKVEDEAGRRYWIYRDGITGDGRGGAPDWYLHGLFA